MPSPCVVRYCKNIGNHRFPKDETFRSRWIEAIEQVKPKLTIRKYSYVCSTHFTQADFIFTARRKHLKSNAIPSIFPWNIARQQDVTCVIQRINCRQAIQPQQQSEPVIQFNPTNVVATYSRTPPVAYVEIPPMLVSNANEDEIIDPLDTAMNSNKHSIRPVTSPNLDIDYVEPSPTTVKRKRRLKT